MKNKGRRHKSGRGPYADGNCKGMLCGITRPINQMGHRDSFDKFAKSKWQKRIRGYFKSKIKSLLN
jgi:hypothetical protein